MDSNFFGSKFRSNVLTCIRGEIKVVHLWILRIHAVESIANHYCIQLSTREPFLTSSVVYSGMNAWSFIFVANILRVELNKSARASAFFTHFFPRFASSKRENCGTSFRLDINFAAGAFNSNQMPKLLFAWISLNCTISICANCAKYSCRFLFVRSLPAACSCSVLFSPSSPSDDRMLLSSANARTTL